MIDAYRRRFAALLHYIDAHLEQALTVERLGDVARCSKFHFHRQFAELYGMGVMRYVQLMRLRRASYQLAFRDLRIIEIALASGYDSHEAFSRAFKKTFGQTPSEFREQPAWPTWHAVYRPLHAMRGENMKSEPQEVKVVDFPGARVAVLEHRGDPNTLEESARKFIAWRRQNHLPPSVSATFNLAYDDPTDTPPEEFRCDLCAETSGPIVGLKEKSIPAGRCAMLRHVGAEDTLGAAIKHLYSDWLPASGEELRDFPLFFKRIRFYPDVPAQQAITEIYLPLA
jgi:AraC family transcriptional regulator